MKLLIVLALTLFAQIAVAGPGPMHGICNGDGIGRMAGGMGAMMKERIFERVAEELELTPEQRDGIRQTMQRFRDDAMALAEQHRAALCALKDADPGDPDYATVSSTASNAAGQLAADAVTLITQTRAEVHAQLTEEQRAEWAELKEDMHERRRERRRHERWHEGPR